jgi:hypothetical protein
MDATILASGRRSTTATSPLSCVYSATSRSTFEVFAICWRTTMAKKRKFPKMTPEEHAQRDETQKMVRERIAYHEAKAREQEARRRAAG